VRRLLSAGPAATSRLSEGEVASAVVRRWREGDLTTDQRDRVLSALSEDLQRMDLVEVLPEVTRRTHALLVRHRLRAGDALQLSACLHLREGTGAEVVFVAFDERLTAAAAAEGLALVPDHGVQVRRSAI
jgi:predicted nucleic acid-binding protein